MQIVIDIDEDDFKIIQHNVAINHPLCPLSEEVVVTKIANGTPLPKGHGRLGDLDALKVEMSNGIKAGLMIEGYESYSNINDMDDCLECVKYAPTIIEADIESEDKE